MPTNPSPSPSSRRRRRRKSFPAWILLNNEGYIGLRPRNATTAIGAGRDNLTLEVSFRPSQPPLPSNLFVFCPGVEFPRPSKILCTAGDLLLFRVPVAAGPPPSTAGLHECDYFVYQTGIVNQPPALTLIPNPKPNFFLDFDVGVLPGGGDRFTIAALTSYSTRNKYSLHRFDSEAGSWVLKSLWLDEPRSAFPVKIPVNACRLNCHITTTVVTLGGEAGTVGWVDLWSGILLYDLLRDDGGEDHPDHRPTLRHMPVPVPVPMHAITCNRGAGAKLGCPRAHRGITVATKHGNRTCLKFADLQTIGGRLPYKDVETGLPAFEVDDWIINTWTNAAMGCSFEDWREDFTVRGSEINMSGAVRAELLASGLLHRKPMRDDGEEPATVELALQNLSVSEPTPSQNGDEDILYLMARTKIFLPKAWVLAIDMRNCTLVGVAEFGTGGGLDASITFRLSTIFKHMKPAPVPAAARGA